MEPNSLAIKICGLQKKYPATKESGERIAVENLNLETHCGSIFGFLGPNGAGKTTTIKMLLGFIKPSCGDAWIFGASVADTISRATVGYVPEQPYYPKFLSSRELVRIHAELSGLPPGAAKKRADECLELVEMSEYARQRLAKLSKGQLQRIALATALAGDPKLLILDEPSSGLDPLGRRSLRELLLRIKSSGKAIFLSSHLLSETENICDRVGVLRKGKLVACGQANEIVHHTDNILIEAQLPEVAPEFKTKLEMWDASIDAELPEGGRLISAPSIVVFEVIDALKTQNARLIRVQPEKETLEEAFIRLVA